MAASEAELRAFSERALPEIRAALADRGDLPPSVEALASAVERGGDLADEVWLAELLEVLGFLEILGRHAVVARVAIALAPTPLTDNRTVYSPVRSAIHLAFRMAVRLGDDATVAVLRQHLVVPDGYRPMPLLLTGGQLRRPLDTMPTEGDAAFRTARASASELARLTLIRDFDGSEELPVARIDAEIDRILAEVPALAG